MRVTRRSPSVQNAARSALEGLAAECARAPPDRRPNADAGAKSWRSAAGGRRSATSARVFEGRLSVMVASFRRLARGAGRLDGTGASRPARRLPGGFGVPWAKSPDPGAALAPQAPPEEAT